MVTKMKVKCPECGHEFEQEVPLPVLNPVGDLMLGDTYSGDYQYGTLEYYKQRYPNEYVPPYPHGICGDMMPQLQKCSKCGELFWTAEFGITMCYKCLSKEKEE